MSQSLAVKYRPKTFDDVVEQGVTVEILKKVVASGDFKNAYLFCGKSGCGKTTLARIFANEINKGVGDPIEIDGASYNGIDQIRSIIAEASQRSLVGEYKIFIIDECHMLGGGTSKAAWAALLKLLEEPPAYSIFMFCTTDPYKVPQTILNRVQRYNITAISQAGIRDRLMRVCANEGFSNYEDACDLISKVAQGGMRDALTLLEQCANYSEDLSISNVKTVLPGVNYEYMLRLTNTIIDGNVAEMLRLVDDLSATGADLKQFVGVYLEFAVDLVKYVLFKRIDATSIPAYLESTDDKQINVKYTTAVDGADKWFIGLADLLLELKAAIRFDSSCAAVVKAYLLKAARGVK